MNPYVEELLKLGIYKIGERQLYECSEEEVKQVLIDVYETHDTHTYPA